MSPDVMEEILIRVEKSIENLSSKVDKNNDQQEANLRQQREINELIISHEILSKQHEKELKEKIPDNFKTINDGFREVKERFDLVSGKMTKFVTKQLIINNELLTFKKDAECKEIEKKEEKNKILWYKRDWFKMVAVSLLTGVISYFVKK